MSAGLTAAAALLIDYVLTVSVSITAGASALISAFPDLAAVRLEICLAVVVLMAGANLRGVRESGTMFANPTYAFIAMVLLTLVVCTVVCEAARPGADRETLYATVADRLQSLHFLHDGFRTWRRVLNPPMQRTRRGIVQGTGDA